MWVAASGPIFLGLAKEGQNYHYDGNSVNMSLFCSTLSNLDITKIANMTFHSMMRRNEKGMVYIAIWVDDSLLVGDKEAILEVVSDLKKEGFNLKLEGTTSIDCSPNWNSQFLQCHDFSHSHVI